MYCANESRYNDMTYNRCGNSGLLLSAVSLGLWHNFGNITDTDTQAEILRTAFDCGITHFDLANNYGPPPGEAERNFGEHMERDFRPYRDELIISTKAGFEMWDGPYGNWGSRKYLISSLDQSLRRMKLDYVDIFYHHRPDPNTPIEETMGALYDIVKSGKALYVGISNYSPEQTATAYETLSHMGIHLLIHQVNYSMLTRKPEAALFDTLDERRVGCIAFCPLAKGMLTDRYLNGIPSDSRVARDPRFLREEDITEERIKMLSKLNELAKERGQSLAQMSLAWCLRRRTVTSVLIGASKATQVKENVLALKNTAFTQDELAKIDEILSK